MERIYISEKYQLFQYKKADLRTSIKKAPGKLNEMQISAPCKQVTINV